MIDIKLSLESQKQNLVDAFRKNGIPFEIHGNAVVLRYTMHGPEYQKMLDRINSTQRELLQAKQIEKGKINYVRGRDLDGQLQPISDRELLVYHFGSEEEFRLLRESMYPPPLFRRER